MKTPSPVSATLAWSDLGLQWLEMMAASGQVIAHRARRGNSPVQLYGMATEKVQAAIESSNAMTRQMIGFPAGGALEMWQAWARVLRSGMAPYHARATSNARASRRA